MNLLELRNLLNTLTEEQLTGGVTHFFSEEHNILDNEIKSVQLVTDRLYLKETNEPAENGFGQIVTLTTEMDEEDDCEYETFASPGDIVITLG